MDKLIPSQNDLQMFETQQAIAAKAQAQQQGGGAPAQEQGPSRLDSAVARAKALSEVEGIKTQKVKNAAEKVKALTQIKEAMKGKDNA